jgi:predicted nuclease of predicted toxin-antitoxin system
MRFLADESCDHAVVRALRVAGHDVAAIAEDSPGITDEQVIVMAKVSGRILLTEDKDFGQLMFAAAQQASGVIFMRFPVTARAGLVDAVLNLVASRGADLYGSFAVIEPGRTRLRRSV